MLVKYFISAIFILIHSCFVIGKSEDCTFTYNETKIYFRRNFTLRDCQETVDECREWCTNDKTIKSEVVDKDKGEVKFSIIPSPYNCCHNSFQIILFLYDDDDCNDRKSCNESCIHSAVDVEEEKCETFNSNELNCGIITFNTKYIFTGTYYFVIQPSKGLSTKQECITQPFFIETNYTKQLIGHTNISLDFKYAGYSAPLVFSVKGVGVSLAEEVIFQLLHTEELCEISVTDKNGEYEGECCNNGVKTGSGTCKWEEEKQTVYLICTFNKIKPGNYCITIEFSDLRCSKRSLWGNNIGSCIWSSSYSLREPVIGSGVELAPQPVDPNATMYWVILLGSIAGIIVAIAMCFFFKRYPEKIYHHYVSCAPSHMQQFSCLYRPKILLLYPRDCKQFMSVMQDFRSLLQEFIHAQVYDIWDPENWENVNEVGHQWVAKFFLDKKVKVIMIASKCSKMFEYALINQRSVHYHIPNYFDNIYLYSFKEAITLANCSLEQYNRFFVVRLDEPNCEENKFSVLTPCTVYTIPQHLKDLTLQIHNMDPGEVILNPEETSKIQQLTSSLAELKKFKLDNPNYLNEMISMVSERH